jgi:hypothetical protein
MFRGKDFVYIKEETIKGAIIPTAINAKIFQRPNEKLLGGMVLAIPTSDRFAF